MRSGKARIVRHEFEIGPVDARELRQLAQRQHALDQEHLVVGDRERALHEAAQLGRHRRFHFEADGRAAAAALERALEQPHQVFGLFLDFDVGVADDAERALPLDRVAREQLRDEQAGRLLQRDHAHRTAVGCAGKRMKRSIFCGTRMSAFIALPSLVRASWNAIEKPRLGMNGNGCAGSMASGVSTGKMYCRK